MTNSKKILNTLNALCIYDIHGDDVIKSLAKLLESVDEKNNEIKAYAEFFNTLCSKNSASDFSSYIEKLMLYNDNCFTVACAGGTEKELDDAVIDAVKKDLKKLETIASLKPSDILEDVEDKQVKEILSDMPLWSSEKSRNVINRPWHESLDEIAAFHLKNGYGEFATSNAFAWRDCTLCPISSSDDILLEDLKCYEIQRQKVVDNTQSFVMGLPANNVLLYGDRGTGKSSTVHAVLNEFAQQGLRMIEVPKAAIPQFPIILEKIVNSPMKFIIFIDDLSFSSDDDSYAQLKAVLEGSISARQKNTLIYATSNRRHLIKESFSSRDGDELHRADTIQETKSLSDRFGLSVTFLNPDKKKYFEIVDKIVSDRKLNADIEKMHRGAERWALEKGGRSPRVARQYVDWAQSRIERGLDW